ncbi:MAG: efflux RND transporter periplasmic adaptor subunit [Bacteroidetes bacterium]|nr:efflux RND transporter periplasmic adaptor subunit [Bacteroidota bacterium]
MLVIVKLFFFQKDVPATGPGNSGGKNAGAAPPMKVNGIVVRGFYLEEKVFASGTVLANEEVELRPEVSGKIIALNIKEGTRVNKGDLLVKINDNDLKAQLSKLENNKKILSDKSGRQKKLFEMNGVSREEYDDVLNQLATVEADIQFTTAQIAKTEIRAPFSGQIGLRNISEGSYVSQNFLIATIQQVNPVKIDFSLPEKYSSYLKSGKEITYTVEGNTRVFYGTVYAIEPKVDAATRSIKIRAISENPDGTILPGAFARVNMIMSHSDSAITIPTEAIIPVLKGKKVMVSRNGMAISQLVNNGLRNESNIEIVSGLNIGDTVITSGIMQLKDSMKVAVKILPQYNKISNKTNYMNIKHGTK